MRHPPLCAALLDKHAPPLPNDNHYTEGFGFSSPEFQQEMLKPGFFVFCPLL